MGLNKLIYVGCDCVPNAVCFCYRGISIGAALLAKPEALSTPIKRGHIMNCGMITGWSPRQDKRIGNPELRLAQMGTLETN